MAWSFYDSNGVLQTGDSSGVSANTALSNLAGVAINTSLVSDTDNTDDLGTSAAKWKDSYLLQLLLEERAAPGTPASGDVALYAKTDGLFYSKRDDGLETLVSGDIVEFDDQVLSDAATYDLSGIPATSGDMIISGVCSPVDDGVNFILTLNNRSTAGNYNYNILRALSTTVTSQEDTNASGMVLSHGSVGNVSGEGVAFEVTIPSYATIPTGEFIRVLSNSGLRNDSGVNSLNVMSGTMDFSEAVNRITLSFNTGNIDVGRVRVFLRGT